RGRRPRIQVILSAVGPSNEHGRDGIALIGIAPIGVLAGSGAAKIEVALRIAWLEIVQPHEARFGPNLEAVAAQDLGHAAGDAVDVVAAADQAVAYLAGELIAFRREVGKHLDSRSEKQR